MAADNKKSVWELSSVLRGLADSCFEEGQYESAITILDQLRASEFNPWLPHLRQLIYISLQPKAQSSLRDEVDPSGQASPSKIIKQQQLQMSLNLIPAEAVVNAQKVLMGYLHTSLPSTLARALPQRRSPLVPVADHSEGDSMLARRAIYIMQFQDCWELLSSEFPLRQSTATSTPKIKVKLRRYSERVGSGTLDATSPVTSSSLVVQENAWPLLEWLVALYEADENSSTLSARCSSLLTDQILDNDGKAHIETPTAIIAHCLGQTQLQRQRLAGRLLSLLVNLTTTADLDLNALTVAIYTHVQSLEQLSQLLSQLGHCASVQTLRFKIGLCQMLISGLGSHAVTVGNVPKPQPRIRPRPVKTTDKEESNMNHRPIVKSSILSTAEVLRLLQVPLPEKDLEGTSFTPLWCKFQLLFAYGTLQVKTDPSDRDTEWIKSIRETLPRIVRQVFEQKGTESSMYQRLLEHQIIGWKQMVDAML